MPLFINKLAHAHHNMQHSYIVGKYEYTKYNTSPTIYMDQLIDQSWHTQSYQHLIHKW